MIPKMLQADMPTMAEICRTANCCTKHVHSTGRRRFPIRDELDIGIRESDVRDLIRAILREQCR